jgi:hypothetical protein
MSFFAKPPDPLHHISEPKAPESTSECKQNFTKFIAIGTAVLERLKGLHH